jgi:GT2 family glycosyltransferase
LQTLKNKLNILQNPSVAIIILNFNGSHFLQKFLPSVIASTYTNKKIIVADNCSTDNSVSMLQNQFPSITIFKNTQNLGFAGGYNWAIDLVEDEIVVLLNSDVEVTPNWIEPIIELMCNNDKIAACQPKLLNYNNKNSFEYAGASGGFIDYLGYPFSRGRVFDILEPDQHQYNTTIPVFWASGAAMFVKTKIFKQLGGFDNRFFAHQEEIDLCWRMQLHNYLVYCCPQSVVYHVGAGTLPRGGRKVYLNFRNNLWMLCKNLPLHEKIWKLPLRFSLDGISAWKGLLGGDVNFFKAIVKAHLSVVFCRYFKEKKINTSKQPMKKLQGVHYKSIVWKHFVLHQNKYSTIVEK